MSITSFFQPRSAAGVNTVTRTAQSSTPRPLPPAMTKPATTASAIVLAWDNVLFPTKWMAECAGLASTNKKLLEDTRLACLNNPFTVQALTAIEQQVLNLLALVTSKTPVFILSDYSNATIDAVCSAFFPRLKACLTNATIGRVHIMGASATAPSEREAWKLSTLQQICGAFMTAPNALQRASPFKVLAVTADEMDARVTARVQGMVAQFGAVQSLSLPSAMANGKPLSLVDFHKQLQAVAGALVGQL